MAKVLSFFWHLWCIYWDTIQNPKLGETHWKYMLNWKKEHCLAGEKYSAKMSIWLLQCSFIVRCYSVRLFLIWAGSINWFQFKHAPTIIFSCWQICNGRNWVECNFGLKSYGWFQTTRFEIKNIISDRNCTTRSSITFHWSSSRFVEKRKQTGFYNLFCIRNRKDAI